MSNKKTISKSVSRLLRHCPNELPTSVDADGWASLNEVVSTIQHQLCIRDSHQIIDALGDQNNPRFEISHGRIRAKYGHSQVEVEYPSLQPLEYLYHATPSQNMASIAENGLTPQRRKYVHMAGDSTMALNRAQHHRSELTILKIDAQRASDDGVRFCCPDKVIWLAKAIPARYIDIRNVLDAHS